MKRFGFVIRTGGDPEIAGALVAGIERGMTESSSGPAGHIPQRGRLWEKQSSEAVRRVAMMRHTPEEWDAMTVQARYDYGQDRPTPRWLKGPLIGYALVCMGVRWLYHQQERLLSGRAS